MESLWVLITIIASLIVSGFLRKAYKAAAKDIENKQNEETLNNVREFKKIDNLADNAERIKLINELQWAEKDH